MRGLGLQGILVTGMNLVHTGLLQSFKLGICVWHRSDTGVPPKFRIAFGIRSSTYPGATPVQASEAGTSHVVLVDWTRPGYLTHGH